MKCPNDQTEMEAGGLYFAGQIWRKTSQNKSIWSYTWPWVKDKNFTVFAYKCPKCGKIELKAEDKN